MFWVNVPDGTTRAIEDRVTADSLGNVPTGKIAYQTVASAPPGIWSIVARGDTTERVAIGYFLLVGSAISRAPSSSIPTSRMRAERRTMRSRSASV